ncbi:hypothetical protein SUBVAR_05590 [Subdoligranulum variabile DSM 15176]|uniref:Uncharacterized protein n=1 Tax=Subdoligranulum variabile DSM 15176 TaxID=411471 RepID=D1PMM7_9FIRM|nr:hypothetical protein SUBVAR_05590 [Subdoligranulum variabile DSM 15176]
MTNFARICYSNDSRLLTDGFVGITTGKAAEEKADRLGCMH